jgi:hypothetical protein
LCQKAELDGTLTERVNETACELGLICGGEKVQVAPVGKELDKQESVIDWLGIPVFAFRESKYLAVPPGETV